MIFKIIFVLIFGIIFISLSMPFSLVRRQTVTKFIFLLCLYNFRFKFNLPSNEGGLMVTNFN